MPLDMLFIFYTNSKKDKQFSSKGGKEREKMLHTVLLAPSFCSLPLSSFTGPHVLVVGGILVHMGRAWEIVMVWITLSLLVCYAHVLSCTKSLPLSLSPSPSLPPSLLPYLPPSLSPSFPTSLPPSSVHNSCYSH